MVEWHRVRLAGSRAGVARRSEPLTRPAAGIRSGSRARQSLAAPGSRAVRRRGLACVWVRYLTRSGALGNDGIWARRWGRQHRSIRHPFATPEGCCCVLAAACRCSCVDVATGVSATAVRPALHWQDGRHNARQQRATRVALRAAQLMPNVLVVGDGRTGLRTPASCP